MQNKPLFFRQSGKAIKLWSLRESVWKENFPMTHSEKITFNLHLCLYTFCVNKSFLFRPLYSVLICITPLPKKKLWWIFPRLLFVSYDWSSKRNLKNKHQVLRPSRCKQWVVIFNLISLSTVKRGVVDQFDHVYDLYMFCYFENCFVSNFESKLLAIQP